MLGYTHPRYVESLGGLNEAASGVAKVSEDLSLKGRNLVSVKLGTPERLQAVQDWLVAFLPEIVTSSEPNGSTSSLNSVQICISEDKGQTWKFMDIGYVSDQHVLALFPELRGNVVLRR